MRATPGPDLTASLLRFGLVGIAKDINSVTYPVVEPKNLHILHEHIKKDQGFIVCINPKAQFEIDHEAQASHNLFIVLFTSVHYAFAPAGRVDDIGVWVILDEVVGSLSDPYFPVAPLLYETMDLNHKPVTDEATIVSLVPLMNTQIKLQFKKVGSLENLVLQKVMETMPDVAREQLPHLFDGYEEQITVMEINH
jgi:hypothetical protein